MTGLPEVRERLAALETEFEVHKETSEREIKAHKEKIAALERFQVMLMTGLAAAGAIITFFADKVRKVLGV